MSNQHVIKYLDCGKCIIALKVSDSAGLIDFSLPTWKQDILPHKTKTIKITYKEVSAIFFEFIFFGS
jgi:hypothetical protein